MARGLRHGNNNNYYGGGGPNSQAVADWSTAREVGTASIHLWPRVAQFFQARSNRLEAQRAAAAAEREHAADLMVRRVQSAWLLGRARQQARAGEPDTLSMLDLVWTRIRKKTQKPGDYLRQMALVLQMAFRRREALVEYNKRLTDRQKAGAVKAVPQAMLKLCCLLYTSPSPRDRG